MLFRTLILTAVLALVAIQVNAQQKIKRDKMKIMDSKTKPGNLLPQFLFQQGNLEGGAIGVSIGGGRGKPHVFSPDDSCGDDIFEGAMTDMRSPQLPYLTQDLWGCEREPTEIDVITLESESMKVTVTPQYAGKIWGMYDTKRQRELLFANRAHQPANIGALKSWAAGGSEWNWSPGIVGHSAFTETTVHTVEIETERGPMLRVYEFDRYNGTTWQVDMMVVNDSVIVHPRVTNPTDVDLRGYWWTCVAVESKPSTRVFAPATHVAENSRGAMRNAPWPVFADAIENASFAGYQGKWPTDNSYLGNHQLGDMFLRIQEDKVYTPYIAHTQTDEDDGYVLVHGHPLNGTKFFTWGQNGPGRFMQDFLAGGGRRQGDYTELQVGPAPTQMQNFPVPKRSVKQWTEWFKGSEMNAQTMRGENYQAALDEIDRWMKSGPQGMTQETVKDWDSFFEKHATDKPKSLIVNGQPWGYVEALRQLKESDGLDAVASVVQSKQPLELVPGLVFYPPDASTLSSLEAQPWIDLLRTGTFSDAVLKRLPLSYQTTDHWLALLQKSADATGMTWLHALHIGIALTERGAIEEPKGLFEQSMKLQPNPIAARCLAVLSSNPTDAWKVFQSAWSLTLAHGKTSFVGDVSSTRERILDNMVTEISFFLQQTTWYDAMEVFIAQVPANQQKLDGFLSMKAKNDIQRGKYDDAMSVLSKNCFPTYASSRLDLMSLWNSAVEGKAGAKDALQRHRARMSTPIPDNIGCQYASEYCINYW